MMNEEISPFLFLYLLPFSSIATRPFFILHDWFFIKKAVGL